MHETKWKHSPRWWKGVVVKKEKRKLSPLLTQSVLCGGKRLLIDTYRNACAMFALVLPLLLRCFPFASALVGIWHNAIFDVSNTISWKISFCLTVLYILFSECLKTICREHIKRKHHKTPVISPFQCRFTTNSRRKTLASLRIVFFSKKLRDQRKKSLLSLRVCNHRLTPRQPKHFGTGEKGSEAYNNPQS